jgi:hypothetical protein
MSRVAHACLLAIALLSSALALGASTPFAFECNPGSAIKSDPNEHKRVGYITAFKGLGAPPISFTPDLKVILPYQGTSPAAPRKVPAAPGKVASPGNTAEVVGIIEKFEWEGGVGSPIKIVFYMSQHNAYQIKSLTQQALKSTRIDELGWWIADYDPVARKWYEQAYPVNSKSISGIVAGKENPELTVDLTPVTLKNATLYKVTMSVAPAANQQYTLRFANSSDKNVVRPWGLTVGALPKSAVGK